MKTEAQNCRVHESWPFRLRNHAVCVSAQRLCRAQTHEKRGEGPDTELKRKGRQTGEQGVEKKNESRGGVRRRKRGTVHT